MRFLIIFIFLTTNVFANDVSEIKNIVIHKDLKVYDNVIFFDKNDKKINIKEFNGNLLLLNFWATWCEPCKKEMYYLDKFHNHFKDTGFKVLTVNTDTPKSMGKVKSYIRSKKYEFLVALDPNQQVMKKMSVKLLPTTILVDKDGSVLFRHQGYSPGDENIILKHITDQFEKDNIDYEPINISHKK